MAEGITLDGARVEGTAEGESVVGNCVGLADGLKVGAPTPGVGFAVEGIAVGWPGRGVGAAVEGSGVGAKEGIKVVGDSVGDPAAGVGAALGVNVGGNV